MNLVCSNLRFTACTPWLIKTNCQNTDLCMASTDEINSTPLFKASSLDSGRCHWQITCVRTALFDPCFLTLLHCSWYGSLLFVSLTHTDLRTHMLAHTQRFAHVQDTNLSLTHIQYCTLVPSKIQQSTPSEYPIKNPGAAEARGTTQTLAWLKAKCNVCSQVAALKGYRVVSLYMILSHPLSVHLFLCTSSPHSFF